MTMSHRDWVSLDRHRRELSARWRQTFEHWDVVVCPVAPTTAFRHDARPFEQRKIDVDGAAVGYEKTPFWAAPATPCGLPVTTVPVGRDSMGLPIGMQIIGPRLEDYTTLAFAELLESTLGCRFTAPPGT
jgi:amidase